MSLYTVKFLKNYIKFIFPIVDHELELWKINAHNCPDRHLSEQAVSSICKKSFHTKGGSAYALYPEVDALSITRLIVAYQTISDYLDNLCDRAGVMDEEAFSYLHLSMLDALDTGNLHDYYKYYPYKDDGGYLNNLVECCRTEIAKLPSFHLVRAEAMELASLYSALQSYKHLPADIREKKLLNWSKPYLSEYNGIFPWEFWAAAGSTLGIFMFFASSYNPDLKKEQVHRIKAAYFPWICGLHIMLDYLIDYNEDIENGDLNFISYYSGDQVLNRIKLFIGNALSGVSNLEYTIFHETVIKGLLSMYISDRKASDSNIADISNSIIGSGNTELKLMHFLCKILRNKGHL
jgi:Protein of unknown function (DUF2600).